MGGEGWHEGVKGIVASRLVGRYHVPVILFTISDGIARGSGRSVGSVNLFQAVERCSDLLVRFGGHAGAVGVTIEAGNLDAFRDRMEDILAELPEEAFEDRNTVAAQVGIGELDLRTVQSLAVMQPFGQGNEVPILAASGVTLGDRRRRGEDGRHLSFTAADSTGAASCIMFNAPDVEGLAEYDGAAESSSLSQRSRPGRGVSTANSTSRTSCAATPRMRPRSFRAQSPSSTSCSSAPRSS